MINQPMPFWVALDHIATKQVATGLSTDDLREMEADILMKSFFSANVENARFLQRAKDLIRAYITKETEEVIGPDGVKRTALKVASRADFVRLMREFMIEEGMAEPEEFEEVNQKDVRDLRSLSRLNLIFDTNVRQAYGYGQWVQGTTPAALKAFPAARLIRDRGVKQPRPRHEAHLGEVRLKTDPWWANYINAREIGGFQVPWGPYGFNSGVTQEDVSRSEARRLGLVPKKPDANPEASEASKPKPKLTDGLQASLKKMDPELKAKLLAELKRGRKQARDPKEAAKQAAIEVRREMLNRGLSDAERTRDFGGAEKYRKALEDLNSQPGGSGVVDDGDSVRIE